MPPRFPSSGILYIPAEIRCFSAEISVLRGEIDCWRRRKGGGMKGNREESEEGTGRVTSCVGADPGELGRLKRLTGLLLVNGSETI